MIGARGRQVAGLLLGCALAHCLSGQNLLKNGGFEEKLPAGGWVLGPQLADRGMLIQSQFGRKSGLRSLKLIPNARNVSTTIGESYGLAQGLQPAPIGKEIYFSAYLAAEGGATAVLRMVAISSRGGITFRELRHNIQNRTATFYRDVIDIPNDPSIVAVVLFCSVEGTTGAAYFDDLVAREGIPGDWQTAMGKADAGPPLDAFVEVFAAQEGRSIPTGVFGTNVEWIWGGQGLIAPDSDKLDADLVGMVKDAGVSLFRFPGGFLSDFYHWRNGVGPRSLRPLVYAYPAVRSGLSSNDFGTDEALELAEKAGGELLITVNAVTGSPEEAADWVRYVNKDKQRVKYWEIGNELYVDLSAFDPALGPVPPAAYAERLQEFARAMKAADPTIKIGAILDFNYGLTTFRPFPDWAPTVLNRAGADIDFVTTHNAFAPVININKDFPVRSVYSAMLAAPLSVKRSLESLRGEIDRLLGADSQVGVSVTEWGPLFEADPQSRLIDHSKTLGSALFVAHVLKVFLEEPRVTAANAFKLLDRLPNGWIGEREGKFIPKAPMYALQMYTKHFGSKLVGSISNSPGYDTRSMGWVDSTPFVPYLESISSLDDEGNLYVLMINKHFDRKLKTSITLRGFCPSGNVTAQTLTGTAIDANTGTTIPEGFAEQATDSVGGRFHQGGPGEITFESSSFTTGSSLFSYELPPHSVVSLKIAGSRRECTAPQFGPR